MRSLSNKKRKVSFDTIGFDDKMKSLDYLESQMENCLIAIKRIKESVNRKDEIKNNKMREKAYLINNLIKVKSKIDSDIQNDINNINKLKTVDTIKDTLIENLNNVRNIFVSFSRHKHFSFLVSLSFLTTAQQPCFTCRRFRI